MKLLQRERGSIAAFRSYNTKTGKIRDFQAWLITPDGRETFLGGKNDVLGELVISARQHRVGG